MKSRNYSPINIEDIYLGEVGYIPNYTKYYVNEQTEENTYYYYDKSYPIRYMIFMLKDGLAYDKESKTYSVLQPKGFANDLMNGTSNYPVLGKINGDYVEDESVVIVKSYNLGALLKQMNFSKQVSYSDLVYFAKLLGLIYPDVYEIEDDLKVLITEMQQSNKGIMKQLKPNLNEALRNRGV